MPRFADEDDRDVEVERESEDASASGSNSAPAAKVRFVRVRLFVRVDRELSVQFLCDFVGAQSAIGGGLDDIFGTSSSSSSATASTGGTREKSAFLKFATFNVVRVRLESCRYVRVA